MDSDIEIEYHELSFCVVDIVTTSQSDSHVSLPVSFHPLGKVKCNQTLGMYKDCPV